jgi:hypothetical protein
LNVLAGLWFFSALFACLAVKCVHGLDRVCASAKRATGPSALPATRIFPRSRPPLFFQDRYRAAGAAPFLGAVYGFAAERLNYQIHRVKSRFRICRPRWMA